MILYVDASWNKYWSLFVVITTDKKIVGYKFFQEGRRTCSDEIEFRGVIAALEILKLYGKKNSYHTIVTDNLGVCDIINSRSKGKFKRKSFQDLYKYGKDLKTDVGCNITWVPRQLNPAGKLLDKVLVYGRVNS